MTTQRNAGASTPFQRDPVQESIDKLSAYAEEVPVIKKRILVRAVDVIILQRAQIEAMKIVIEQAGIVYK